MSLLAAYTPFAGARPRQGILSTRAGDDIRFESSQEMMVEGGGCAVEI